MQNTEHLTRIRLAELEEVRAYFAPGMRVLELGGYAREFFVSQTPELTGMADALIDLEAMSVEGCST